MLPCSQEYEWYHSFICHLPDEILFEVVYNVS